jgi:hypothetical protein
MFDARRRPELTPPPPRIARLPVDKRGFPVPFFVEWIAGEPDFRVMDQQKFARAVREKLCWVCGDKLGAHMTFVVGPMCGINRTSSEPPAHHDCAHWSARNCPFLARPHMTRRETQLPEGAHVGEAALDRNPGVTLLWTTKAYELFKAPGASAVGYLIRMGDPERIEWWSEGRPATRAEVTASIEGGLPALLDACDKELTPMARLNARDALAKARAAFEQKHLPAA